jgi:hypothetical protein
VFRPAFPRPTRRSRLAFGLPESDTGANRKLRRSCNTCVIPPPCRSATIQEELSRERDRRMQASLPIDVAPKVGRYMNSCSANARTILDLNTPIFHGTSTGTTLLRQAIRMSISERRSDFNSMNVQSTRHLPSSSKALTRSPGRAPVPVVASSNMLPQPRVYTMAPASSRSRRSYRSLYHSPLGIRP